MLILKNTAVLSYIMGRHKKVQAGQIVSAYNADYFLFGITPNKPRDGNLVLFVKGFYQMIDAGRFKCMQNGLICDDLVLYGKKKEYIKDVEEQWAQFYSISESGNLVRIINPKPIFNIDESPDLTESMVEEYGIEGLLPIHKWNKVALDSEMQKRFNSIIEKFNQVNDSPELADLIRKFAGNKIYPVNFEKLSDEISADLDNDRIII